jgi:hypothetical protein
MHSAAGLPGRMSHDRDFFGKRRVRDEGLGRYHLPLSTDRAFVRFLTLNLRLTSKLVYQARSELFSFLGLLPALTRG